MGRDLPRVHALEAPERLTNSTRSSASRRAPTRCTRFSAMIGTVDAQPAASRCTTRPASTNSAVAASNGLASHDPWPTPARLRRPESPGPPIARISRRVRASAETSVSRSSTASRTAVPLIAGPLSAMSAAVSSRNRLPAWIAAHRPINPTRALLRRRCDRRDRQRAVEGVDVYNSSRIDTHRLTHEGS